MSYITVYTSDKNGEVSRYGTVQDSREGAMLIWKELIGVYGFEFNLFIRKGHEDLWTSAEKGAPRTLTREHSLLVVSTFDNIWIEKKNNWIADIAASWENFHKDFVEGKEIRESVAEVAKLLRIADADPDVMGVAFSQTSYSGFCFSGPDMNEDGKCLPYNVHTMNKHNTMESTFDTGHLARLNADR